MGKTSNGNDQQASLKLAPAYLEAAPRISRMGVRRALNGQDVAQEAALRVLQAKDAVVENPVRYLLRVARNLFVDAERARARERLVLEYGVDMEDRADGYPDAERALAAKERLEMAMAVIGDLPPRCGEAFRLHRFEGLSYVAIARQMGISPSMVEKHIAEAMLRLVRALGRDDH